MVGSLENGIWTLQLVWQTLSRILFLISWAEDENFIITYQEAVNYQSVYYFFLNDKNLKLNTNIYDQEKSNEEIFHLKIKVLANTFIDGL